MAENFPPFFYLIAAPQMDCGAAVHNSTLRHYVHCGAAVVCRPSLNYGAIRALLCDPRSKLVGMKGK